MFGSKNKFTCINVSQMGSIIIRVPAGASLINGPLSSKLEPLESYYSQLIMAYVIEMIT